MTYDSTKDTQDHIDRVRGLLNLAATELVKRGIVHDKSKLESPEKEHFDRETPLLAGLTFGTEEYLEGCKRLKPALDHHYANNSHHPQYYENGINGMSLFDLVEMVYDWSASVERGQNGDIFKSLDINSNRFGISKQLKQIIHNTLIRYNFSKK